MLIDYRTIIINLRFLVTSLAIALIVMLGCSCTKQDSGASTNLAEEHTQSEALDLEKTTDMQFVLRIFTFQPYGSLEALSLNQYAETAEHINSEINKAYISPLPDASADHLREAILFAEKEAVVYDFLAEHNKFKNPYWSSSLARNQLNILFIVNYAGNKDYVVLSSIRSIDDYPLLAEKIVQHLQSIATSNELSVSVTRCEGTVFSIDGSQLHPTLKKAIDDASFPVQN